MSNLLCGNYEANIALLDDLLKVKDSFDVIEKPLLFANRRATMYLVDGLVKDTAMFKIMSPIMKLTQQEVTNCKDVQEFIDRFLPYIEVETESDCLKIVGQVLAGPAAIIIEGFDSAILMDTRTYPTRSLSEPESDRVLRGARDSFCETIVLNTALIRRHVRDPRLTMEHFSIGKVSKTDVVLCYFKERADKKAVKVLQDKLCALDVSSLAMGQQSLLEGLIKKRWYNPFPKARYTERPDSAAATAAEGGIVLLVDGTPSVMLLPTSFLDFFQDTNDYYFPPIVGTYLRFARFIIYLLTLLLIPSWYLLIKNPEFIPTWLDFIKIKEMNEVPIFFQLMIVELIIDCLRQASLNTPSSLGGSFAVVAGLILGDFAVSARWFVSEVLLYMAFVAVANFAQPSFELGYAVKLSRILLIVLTALFNVWGFAAGIIITFLLVATTPTITNQSYLYPVIPFDGEKLLRLLIRRRMNSENS